MNNKLSVEINIKNKSKMIPTNNIALQELLEIVKKSIIKELKLIKNEVQNENKISK